MTQIKTDWAPSKLINGYFLQNQYWIDTEGKVHKVEEMHPAYCLNVILYLERCAPQIYLDVTGEEDCELEDSANWMYATPLYKRIKERVVEQL